MATPERSLGPLSHWLIATDFDGTLTREDIGNALCERVLGERFFALHKRYKSGELNLRNYQQEVWTGFPLGETKFRQLAAELGHLRPGVNQFLEACADAGTPVLVLSCGIRAYIDAVMTQHLSAKARRAIVEIECNSADFDSQSICRLVAPDPNLDSPVPLHKGQWVADRRKRYPERKVLAIGNGSSDFSFAGHVDRLAATEGLAKWCVKQDVKFDPFDDFNDIARLFAF